MTDHGFGILNALTFQRRMAELSVQYPYQEAVPVPIPAPITPVGQPTNGAATVSLNVRNAPTTSGTRIGGLLAGQKTVYYPEQMVQADGFPWVVVTLGNGVLGWAAMASASGGTPWIVPELLPESWTVKLDVPYVSQTDVSAGASNNDCLVASIAMLTRWWFKRVTGLSPDLPTVDDMTKYTALVQPNPPKGLTFAQGMTLAARYGFPSKYLQPVTADMLSSYLDAKIPVTVLLDYHQYNPAGAKIAHVLVVCGYSPSMFLTHDPYKLGAYVAIPRQQLLDAMASSPGNSIGYQGMALSA